MLNTFKQLLGDDAPVLRRYLLLAVSYGVLCGLTILSLVPVVAHLFARDIPGVVPWLAVLLAGLVICWVWRRHVEEAGVRVGVAVLREGRHRLGNHVASLPVGWYTQQNNTWLSHLVTQGMMAVAQLPAHVFTPVIAGVVTPLVLVIALFWLHWPLGIIALAALPLIASVLAVTGKLSRRADAAYQQGFASTSQRVVEFAQAQSVLRAFNGEGGGTRLLEHAIDRQRQSGMRLIWLSASAVVLNAWVVQIAFAALLFAAVRWLDGQAGGVMTEGQTVGVIVALLLVSRYIDALLEVVGYGEVLRGARAQLDAIRQLFAMRPLPEPGEPQLPEDMSVQMHDVSFRYTPDAPDVLRGINVHIAPGSMVAFIGASGSGKTTLVRLLARFFDVNTGCVLVGGVDVRQMTGAQLAGQISQIFQDNYLFSGSIADNIRLGKPDASDADIMQVAQQAGVAEIIARLPQGLDTPVGEGGARLSGGERQRVAIARALIKDAPILLVDEATAALDAENQAAIAQTLARLKGQRTLIVIAHQLSTVAMADKIVVLEEGEVVEQGTPVQLRENNGPYAQFLQQRQAAKGWRISSATAQGVSS